MSCVRALNTAGYCWRDVVGRPRYVYGFKRRYSYKSGAATDPFRTLPRVPTTQFLSSNELTRDILFSGYRPVMYPVKENPLFNSKKASQHSNHDVQEIVSESSSKPGTLEPKEAKEYNVMEGPRGCGGIKSGGVNGTWRFNPRIPSSLTPYNWWSTSVMGMEYYPEWQSVPEYVTRTLKPYDKHLPMNGEDSDAAVVASIAHNTNKFSRSTDTHTIIKKRSGNLNTDKLLQRQLLQYMKYWKEKD